MRKHNLTACLHLPVLSPLAPSPVSLNLLILPSLFLVLLPPSPSCLFTEHQVQGGDVRSGAAA
jgi:hypothetical protein